MKRELQQKLSERLAAFFLRRLREYNTTYYQKCRSFTNSGISQNDSAWFAEKMAEDCMKMIAEYEPEDIE